ncbi:MAG: ARMT1-like domain-containing protein [Candidatus Latescibacterota bacterium]
MKVENACIPCIMKQAYNTARRATSDQDVIRAIMNKAADHVKSISFDMTPADASNYVYEITKELTGIADPYFSEKQKYNQICRSMLPEIRKRIEASNDPLQAAVRVAILGNLIDLGIGLEFDLDKDLERVFTEPFAADDYESFAAFLKTGRKRILYLGDNAGEIFFDRLLVEKLCVEHTVTFVVKKGPIINDATLEDAQYAGITDLVKVIDTGSCGIGVKWSEASKEFMEEYQKADMIISKGQGNFETMSGKKGKKYFLLRAKCDSVAGMLGVSFGGIVIKESIDT